MEDLKKIQEFFSKPLEEGKQLDIVDFAKVVQAVQQTGHPATVLLILEFNEIEILTGMNAPDDMLRDLSNAVDSLGYGRDNIIIAADSSNLSRREYNDIRRVNGGHKDYFEEATKDEETEFHSKLDKLVHDTFGKRKGEMEEYNTGIYYTPDTKEKTKDAAKSGVERVKDMLKKIMKEEEGYSQFLKTDDNPEGKTKGLTPDTMNKILMNVIKDLDESRPGLWDNIRAKKEKGGKMSHPNSKAYKSAVKAGKKINSMSESSDTSPEEKAFDAELMTTANGIAVALGKELKAKKGDKEQLDEIAITTIVAGVLTANTLVSFISKMSAKLFKKLNWKKGEDFAEKIHHWAHDNEVAFQAPIKRVLSLFIKDEKTLNMVTKGIYAIVVATMAAGYGGEAVSSLTKADWFKGALSSLKAIAKSDEAIVNAYPAIKAFIA